MPTLGLESDHSRSRLKCPNMEKFHIAFIKEKDSTDLQIYRPSQGLSVSKGASLKG